MNGKNCVYIEWIVYKIIIIQRHSWKIVDNRALVVFIIFIRAIAAFQSLEGNRRQETNFSTCSINIDTKKCLKWMLEWNGLGINYRVSILYLYWLEMHV